MIYLVRSDQCTVFQSCFPVSIVYKFNMESMLPQKLGSTGI